MLQDKFRKLNHKRSLADLVSHFSNIVVTIPGITEEEQPDRFFYGLKPEIKLEVLKGNLNNMNEAVLRC
jgi:hypothetical protein